MIDFTGVKAIVIPEGVATKIVSGAKTLWERVAGITNLLPLATDLDRTTILNGVGYLTGYRLSSSTSVVGCAVALSGMCTSGFIPAQPGDILRIKGTLAKLGTASYVISFTSANEKVGYRSLAFNNSSLEWDNSSEHPWQSYANGILTIDLSSAYFGTGFDAVRFSAGTIDENTIVTINEEIV